jgi:hypothetical protein
MQYFDVHNEANRPYLQFRNWIIKDFLVFKIKRK